MESKEGVGESRLFTATKLFWDSIRDSTCADIQQSDDDVTGA
jgi:hypothetical protein